MADITFGRVVFPVVINAAVSNTVVKRKFVNRKGDFSSVSGRFSEMHNTSFHHQNFTWASKMCCPEIPVSLSVSFRTPMMNLLS